MILLPTVFADLQGTLGGEGGGDITQLEFYPGVIGSIRRLNENTLLVIVITNQSRIGWGKITEHDYQGGRMRSNWTFGSPKTMYRSSFTISTWMRLPISQGGYLITLTVSYILQNLPPSMNKIENSLRFMLGM